MLTLITNANVFAPEPLGLQSLMIAGSKIVYLSDAEPSLGAELDVQRIDLQGQALVPGLIDGHTHITGGGGEAGFATRVPPVPLSQFTRYGVTTVVGLLGTDDTTRTTSGLLAQVYSLREEGLSAYCYTGGYHYPATTLTGSIRSDIVHLEPVLGLGELAISDHRSSQPTFAEFCRAASEVHVAGLMTGKAGLLHLHLGDGERGLSLINRALDETELPARTFHPTHVNRRKALFKEACELTQRGSSIDVTAFPESENDDEWSAAEAVDRYLHERFDSEMITVSSDGGGCLPVFDAQGELVHLDYAKSQSLMDSLRQLVQNGRPVEQVLPAYTSNVAKILRLAGKGRIAVGADADLVGLSADMQPTHVMAMGRWHRFEEQQVIAGLFE